MASRSTLRNTDPKKVSGELFALTYGGLVSTLLRDYENVDDVNKQVNFFDKIAIHFFQTFSPHFSLKKWAITLECD